MPEIIMAKYPGATAWAFGDSPAMADELAALVIAGTKTATCSALSGYASDEPLPQIGQYSIILNSEDHPVCVIRTTSLHLVRFNEMTPAMAGMEGEGDLSLAYWQEAHQDFFTRAGCFDEKMELVVEIFERVELL